MQEVELAVVLKEDVMNTWKKVQKYRRDIIQTKRVGDTLDWRI